MSETHYRVSLPDLTFYQQTVACQFACPVRTDGRAYVTAIARGVKRLVVSCPCCTFTIQNLWPRFYGADLPFQIVHVIQVMAEAVTRGQLTFSRSTDETLVYHDPCYLARGVRLVEEPRQILAAIPDVHLVEMGRNRERAKCCGAAGGD